MQNWNQTPNEILANLNRIAQEFEQKPRIPVGIVFKASLKSQIEKHFEKQVPITESPTNPVLPVIAIPGVAIFYDHDQQADCIKFFDNKALSLYLNRKEHPEEWAKYLQSIFL